MGKAVVLAATIRRPVVTTDPLFVKFLLRDGGDSSLLCWQCTVAVNVTVTGVLAMLLAGLVCLRKIDYV